MRKPAAVGIGLLLVGAGLGLARCHRPFQHVASVVESAASVDAPSAMTPTVVRDEPAAPTREQALRGLDVVHLAIGDDGASTSLPNGNTAHLTLDTRLQRTASSLMAQHKLPEAAVVVMDSKTGAVLVYASHVESGAARDLVVEAKAPSASVFKIVTASALVEHADLGADTKQCYAGGGEQRVTLGDLDEDPLRDKWCPTLANAMGKSTNTVFARLASKRLDAHTLDSTARALGYGEPIAFDVPNEASSIVLPEDKLGFARTAAGFWNTTLSPLEAVMLSESIGSPTPIADAQVRREARDQARDGGASVDHDGAHRQRRDVVQGVSRPARQGFFAGNGHRGEDRHAERSGRPAPLLLVHGVCAVTTPAWSSAGGDRRLGDQRTEMDPEGERARARGVARLGARRKRGLDRRARQMRAYGSYLTKQRRQRAS